MQLQVGPQRNQSPVKTPFSRPGAGSGLCPLERETQESQTEAMGQTTQAGDQPASPGKALGRSLISEATSTKSWALRQSRAGGLKAPPHSFLSLQGWLASGFIHRASWGVLKV